MFDDDAKAKASRTKEIAPGSSNATNIEVWVKKTGDGKKPNEIICSITPKAGSEHYVSNDTITLPSFTGPFQITFDVVEPLEWQDHDPFNTEKGNCPARGGTCKDQIWLQPADGSELSVLNLNSGQKCKVHYRMNFADGTWCDPVMDNGGNSFDGI